MKRFILTLTAGLLLAGTASAQGYDLNAHEAASELDRMRGNNSTFFHRQEQDRQFHRDHRQIRDRIRERGRNRPSDQPWQSSGGGIRFSH